MATIVSGISIGLFYLLFLAVPALLILALISGLVFGGAQRNAQALLASGVFSLLTGGFYLYGLASSYFAKQDNSYLGNGLLGLLFLAGGVGLVSAGLAGAGAPKWATIGLGLAGLVGVVPLYGALPLESNAGGVGIALYVALGLLAGAVGLLALRRRPLLGRALGLGVTGAVVALVIYALVGLASGANLAAYAQSGVDQALGHKPPVLEGFSLLAWFICGLAVYLFGRRAGGAPTPPTPLAPTQAPTS